MVRRDAKGMWSGGVEWGVIRRGGVWLGVVRRGVVGCGQEGCG